jgi:MFS family permease
MVVVAAVAQYMSAPGQSYSVAAFKGPMRGDLQVSETDYSLAYGTATIVSACLLPFVGRLVDRLGARIMLPVIGTLLSAACFFMSRVSTLDGLYLGFMGVRSIGQGALSLVSVWLVGEWFTRRRGIATACAGLGGGLSVMTVPLINNWFIENYNWQTAWIALSFLVWLSLVIPGWLLIRDRPEDLGMRPDGIAAGTSEPTPSGLIAPTEEPWTVKEVLRDLTFWRLLAVPATSGLVGTGLIFHQVSLMDSHGFASTTALQLMSVQAGFAILLTFPAGWATDRIESRRLLSVAMICLSIAVVLMIALPTPRFVIAYALLLGMHGSILRSTGQVVWINFYGRENQGAVRGAAWSAMILASAIGPLPLAYSIDHFGSYRPALIGFLIMPIFAVAAVWTARQPTRRIA